MTNESRRTFLKGISLPLIATGCVTAKYTPEARAAIIGLARNAPVEIVRTPDDGFRDCSYVWDQYGWTYDVAGREIKKRFMLRSSNSRTGWCTCLALDAQGEIIIDHARGECVECRIQFAAPLLFIPYPDYGAATPEWEADIPNKLRAAGFPTHRHTQEAVPLCSPIPI